MRCSTAARSTALRFKVDLPNYGVFDEKRVFAPGPMPGPVNFRGVRLGLPICEDIWGEEIVECLAETGAEMLVVPNGSPYWRERRRAAQHRGGTRHRAGLPTVYVNQVGAQDELVFDGVSFGLHADCSLAFHLRGFRGRDRHHALAAHGDLGCDGGPMVPRSKPTKPITRPACWAFAITSTRTASRVS